MHADALPTLADCAIIQAGYAWDAIRVPRSLGLKAIEGLSSRTGAVIEDPSEAAVYWLIPPGASAGWDVVGTRTLGRTHYLVVPPARRTRGPGPFWRVCPGVRKWHTDVGALREALLDARAVLGVAQVRP